MPKMYPPIITVDLDGTMVSLPIQGVELRKLYEEHGWEAEKDFLVTTNMMRRDDAVSKLIAKQDNVPFQKLNVFLSKLDSLNEYESQQFEEICEKYLLEPISGNPASLECLIDNVFYLNDWVLVEDVSSNLELGRDLIDNERIGVADIAKCLPNMDVKKLVQSGFEDSDFAELASEFYAPVNGVFDVNNRLFYFTVDDLFTDSAVDIEEKWTQLFEQGEPEQSADTQAPENGMTMNM